MSEADEHETAKPPSRVGRVEWLDITVENASGLRDFYKRVVGWRVDQVEMGSYADFNMKTADGKTVVAGICHARGTNENLPAQWLVYVRVEDIIESIAACERLGGKVIDGPKRMAGSNFCVIQDPAGAYMALMSE